MLSHGSPGITLNNLTITWVQWRLPAWLSFKSHLWQEVLVTDLFVFLAVIATWRVQRSPMLINCIEFLNLPDIDAYLFKLREGRLDGGHRYTNDYSEGGKREFSHNLCPSVLTHTTATRLYRGRVQRRPLFEAHIKSQLMSAHRHKENRILCSGDNNSVSAYWLQSLKHGSASLLLWGCS